MHGTWLVSDRTVRSGVGRPLGTATDPSSARDDDLPAERGRKGADGRAGTLSYDLIPVRKDDNGDIGVLYESQHRIAGDEPGDPTPTSGSNRNDDGISFVGSAENGRHDVGAEDRLRLDRHRIVESSRDRREDVGSLCPRLL